MPCLFLFCLITFIFLLFFSFIVLGSLIIIVFHIEIAKDIFTLHWFLFDIFKLYYKLYMIIHWIIHCLPAKCTYFRGSICLLICHSRCPNLPLFSLLSCSDSNTSLCSRSYSTSTTLASSQYLALNHAKPTTSSKVRSKLMDLVEIHKLSFDDF